MKIIDLALKYGYESPSSFSRAFQNGMFESICKLTNQEPRGVLGVSTCMNGEDFDYYIACSTDKSKPENMCEYEIPVATWAIFDCIGPMPDSIQDLQKRIITEWLPTSGYEYADAPDIEVYSEGDGTAPDYKSQVWVPVVKKNIL